MIIIVACSDSPRAKVEKESTPAQPVTVPAADIDSATRNVVSFLRGETPFERIAVADSVILQVTPEGGGAKATLRRDQLRNPSSWMIPSGTTTYSLVPPPGLTLLSTRIGRHFNCLQFPLSSRVPELAHYPHVGVKLEPSPGGNCLQTWNATFVFDSVARPPRLIAVVYDQWEW